ncbi:MAG: hypothetical protein M1540_05665 [Candidatus Bathyarchaeota archaeon]|nr:hypothetical protein [Candidatus Bathyarchaeota archaeon]
MSEIEDPAATILRLLRTQMRVVLDSGGLASVDVSGEYQNSDAFKVSDGQVTVALAENVDAKLDLSGKIRRRTSTVRVNAWATETLSQTETATTIRKKIADEVNRIIRQYCRTPNQTTCNYVGLSPNTQGSKAYSGSTEAAPTASGWTELSVGDYQNLWYSDDNRCQVSRGGSGEHAILMFGFKIESRRSTVKQAVFAFEGFGSAPTQNGVAVKAWNDVAGAWQNTQNNSASESDEQLSLSLTANLADCIDDDGFLWFLAETNGASDGATPAVLTCDCASCVVSVNGVTYCDVAGSRNLDRVDLKPPVYRTEFTVKSWYIENIGE